MTACYYNNIRIVEALINANVNLDIRDISNNTAKDLAQENGNIECVKLINYELGLKPIDQLFIIKINLN